MCLIICLIAFLSHFCRRHFGVMSHDTCAHRTASISFELRVWERQTEGLATEEQLPCAGTHGFGYTKIEKSTHLSYFADIIIIIFLLLGCRAVWICASDGLSLSLEMEPVCHWRVILKPTGTTANTVSFSKPNITGRRALCKPWLCYAYVWGCAVFTLRVALTCGITEQSKTSLSAVCTQNKLRMDTRHHETATFAVSVVAYV